MQYSDYSVLCDRHSMPHRVINYISGRVISYMFISGPSKQARIRWLNRVTVTRSIRTKTWMESTYSRGPGNESMKLRKNWTINLFLDESWILDCIRCYLLMLFLANVNSICLTLKVNYHCKLPLKWIVYCYLSHLSPYSQIKNSNLLT